jgi:hypothetical protein
MKWFYKTMDDEKIPDEISEAIEAYEKEYSKIRDKVIANNEKYKETTYEDCPPLLDEQMQFFVRRAECDAERERLKEKYGFCPLSWAIRMAWYKRQKSD